MISILIFRNPKAPPLDSTVTKDVSLFLRNLITNEAKLKGRFTIVDWIHVDHSLFDVDIRIEIRVQMVDGLVNPSAREITLLSEMVAKELSIVSILPVGYNKFACWTIPLSGTSYVERIREDS